VVSRGAPVSGPASCPARARQHAHAPRPFQDTHHTRARAHTHTHTHTHTQTRSAPGSMPSQLPSTYDPRSTEVSP
jgi:hypothetical protein